MYVLTNKIAAVRAEEATQKVSDRPARRPDPAARHPRQRGRMPRDPLHELRGRRLVRRARRRACLRHRVLGRRGRAAIPTRALPKGASADYRYYVPLDQHARGRALPAPRPRLPRPGQPRPVRRRRRGAARLDLPRPERRRRGARDGLQSGWEAIVRPAGAAEFRENVQLYHEIGNENEKTAVLKKNGTPLDFIDPHTDAYRPVRAR